MSPPTGSGDADCGCCPPEQPGTRLRGGNRPGLSHVDYRAGVWADFRAAMLRQVTEAVGTASPLAALRTRDTDDPTVALVDAWAMACDVLTFYTERLAQESYLGTAQEPVSLQELGRLIAYRLDPGVAAETPLAFTLEPALTTPVTTAAGAAPGSTPPPVPAEVTLPVGLRVQSVPGPGELPQTFETVEPMTGRPEWNALPVTPTRADPPNRGQLYAWLRGTTLTLAPGDAVLITGLSPATTDLTADRWDLRLVDQVEPDLVLGSTRVRFERPLGSDDPINVPAEDAAGHVLRKRLRVFGHNAPVWPTLHPTFRTGYLTALGITDPTEAEAALNGPDWPRFDAMTPVREGRFQVDLDGSHPDVVAGSWVVVSSESGSYYRELYEVTARAELSRSAFGVSGPVTRLTLRGEEHDFETPRDVTVLAAAEPVELTEAPDTSDLTGQVILVEGDAAAMPPGRSVVVTGRSSDQPVAEAAVVATALTAGTTPSGGPRTELRLARPLTRSYDRARTTVLGNVARATHGETVEEVLGSGDARRAFQTFALAQGPLTHVQAGTADGSASTLHVDVDGTTWRQVVSHHDAGPGDRTFTHAPGHEPHPSTGLPADLVGFGDGVRGARLPSGSHNVRARYRKGTGAAGNLAPGQLSQPMDRPLGLRGADNPLPSEGGTEPEPVDAARTSIPVSTRTLGRAVSLHDYADFARAFAGVSRADARVLPLRAGRTVVVSVTGPGGVTAAGSTTTHLTSALRSLGDPLVRVEVVAAEVSRFQVSMRVETATDRDAETVREAVVTALRQRLGAAARELGEPVHASAVIATAATVPGVVSVDLDALHRVGRPETLEPRLVADPARVSATGTALGAELLALSDNPPEVTA